MTLGRSSTSTELLVVLSVTRIGPTCRSPIDVAKNFRCVLKHEFGLSVLHDMSVDASLWARSTYGILTSAFIGTMSRLLPDDACCWAYKERSSLTASATSLALPVSDAVSEMSSRSLGPRSSLCGDADRLSVRSCDEWLTTRTSFFVV